MQAEEISCYASLIILIIIGLLYLINSRKVIINFILKRELPHHELQKRKCPGCGSEDIMVEGKGTMRCNKCGVLFGGGK